MNSPLIIPAPDTIPVHWFWFQILLSATFMIHLLLMNLVVGGALLTVWNFIRKRDIGAEMSHLPSLIALTINMGVPPLLFVMILFGQFFFTSSILMAVYWILLVAALIVAYCCAYIFQQKIHDNPEAARRAVFISAAMLLYTGFLLVNNSTMAMRPDHWNAWFSSPGGGVLHLADASVWPRYLHFLVAAVAVASLASALWARYSGRIKSGKNMERHIRSNLRVFGIATALQFLVGAWFLLAVPSHVAKAFMGGNMAATIVMSLSIISALLILHSAFTGRLTSSLILLLVQVALMVAVREFTRYEYLSGIFHPAQLRNVNQTSPLVAFLLIFLLGIAATFYMIRLAMRPAEAKNTRTRKARS
jgi:hypothetical protein